MLHPFAHLPPESMHHIAGRSSFNIFRNAAEMSDN
jgi:hypothetical protein